MAKIVEELSGKQQNKIIFSASAFGSKLLNAKAQESMELGATVERGFTLPIPMELDFEDNSSSGTQIYSNYDYANKDGTLWIGIDYTAGSPAYGSVVIYVNGSPGGYSRVEIPDVDVYENNSIRFRHEAFGFGFSQPVFPCTAEITIRENCFNSNLV
jgi:hypothetical protein